MSYGHKRARAVTGSVDRLAVRPDGRALAAADSFGGYFFGKLLLQVHHALAPIVFVLALAAFFGGGYRPAGLPPSR
jgi:hypothetical protein